MPLAAAQVTTTMQHAAHPNTPNGSLQAGHYTLVFRIRRISTKELLREHRLILMPQRFDQQTEARTALYYTQGGPVADTLQGGGVGITYFRIQGHTGYWGVLAPNAGPVGNRLGTVSTLDSFVQVVEQVFTSVVGGSPLQTRQSFVDGAAAIKSLQDDILAYFLPHEAVDIGEEVTQTQDLQLEFYNFMAPTSAEDPSGRIGWRIHPHQHLVDIQQDARQPFLYHYTFQFPALSPLNEPPPDPFPDVMSDPVTGLRAVLRQITDTVQAVTNGVNTINDAFDQLVIQNVTGPISTFLLECTNLGDAIGHFMSGTADKLRFPLYAQRTLENVLDAPRHSVTTLAAAAKELGQLLVAGADPRSISHIFTGTALVGGSNDDLTLCVNQEDPVTLHLGTQNSGPAIAAAIQAQMQAQTAQDPANAAAYRDFTATYTSGQYVLSGGTKGSDAGSVQVIVPTDPAFAPADASAVLGLGVTNGGQEQAGSAYALPALALLRGVEQACMHLQAFPDYFADQLATQDAALGALTPPEATRSQIRGEQRLVSTTITPGDTLQGIANRVGVNWQTLAVVNRLTYPYIVQEPTTLVTGRVSSADYWQVTDTQQHWMTDAFQGQQLDLISGPGAGQSRRIVRSTATQLILETAWSVVPTSTTTYAIRGADNPILRTGSVTSASIRTVTDTAVPLVPGSQRGFTLLLTSGATAGERQQILDNDATTLTVESPWQVIPAAQTLYAILRPSQATRRYKVVGDALSVPQPSTGTLAGIRSRLHDVSAITGLQVSQEEQLFGRDLVLTPDGVLVYDPAVGDATTVAGVRNLRQAMIHYVNLPLGELEYAPGIGSYLQEELGLVATVPLQSQVLSSLERTITQDPRIARMNGAHLVTQGGMSSIVFSAVAINGASVDRVVVR